MSFVVIVCSDRSHYQENLLLCIVKVAVGEKEKTNEKFSVGFFGTDETRINSALEKCHHNPSDHSVTGQFMHECMNIYFFERMHICMLNSKKHIAKENLS